MPTSLPSTLPSGAGLRSALIAALTTLAAWSCGTPAEPRPETPPPPARTLGVEGLSNEFVSLAASGPHVVAAWAASDPSGVANVYTATSSDAGETFGAPVRVNDVAGDARANGEQPPRVAVIRQGTGAPRVVVFWLARRASGSVLLTAQSVDGGQHYDTAIVVPGTDTVGTRGWQALGVGADGAVDLVWLDHRRIAPRPAGTTPHVHADSPATGPKLPAAPAADALDTAVAALQSDLYFTRLSGALEPSAVTEGVCYCCKTAIAHGADGAIYLAWRHVYPGNLRDIAFSVSRDGGRSFSEPVRVSEDGWSIAGCPDDGPSMTVDGAGRVHVVWPTAVTTADGTMTKRLFHAVTTDGRTFSARTPIPHGGDASHPQVVADTDGRVVVAWDEWVGDVLHVHQARGSVGADGTVTLTLAGVPPARGRYPAIAVAEGNLVTAWAERQNATSAIRLSTAPLD